jgi:Ankyrin repeats (3 copies)
MGKREDDDPATDIADTLAGLTAGDFSRLEPRFVGNPAPIVTWIEAGELDAHPDALAEALTCACFLGHLAVARLLLARGVAVNGGSGTGLDAVHWAVNRGQLAAVDLLIEAGASLETRNMYGGTALGAAVWAALHEPRADHVAIIEKLLAAGARIEEAGGLTGAAHIDDVLRRHLHRPGGG